MIIRTLALGSLLLLSAVGPSLAQSKPIGTQVLNQVSQAATLSTGSNFVVTRGIYVGDATACAASLYFSKNSNYVTFSTLQPGVAYPFQIYKIDSTGTTCTSVIGLW